MVQLGVWDYAIIAGYLTGVVALGLMFSGRQTSTREYFLAGCNVPWWAVSVSMYATALSPITFLGATGWIFAKDTRGMIGSMWGLPLVILQIFLWVPLLSRLRMQSIFSYLEQRFHPAVRSVAAVMFLIQMVFWIGSGTVAAARAFEEATGIDPVFCLLALIVLGTLYTMLGGSRAVIWTDVAQYTVFLFAFIAIGCLLLHQYDWQPWRIYNIASSVISEETGKPKTQLFSYELSLAIEATIWVMVFGRIIDAVMFGTAQVTVQRLMAVDTRRNMVKAIIGTSVISIVFMVLYVTISWGFVAFYHDNPALKEALDHPDKVMADYTVRFVPMIARGVIMAGLMAAMMSSFDSALNSMSSVMINDYYRRYWFTNKTEQQYVAISRMFTVIGGCALLVFALWQLQNLDFTIAEQLGKLNNLVMPALPCFFVLGILARRANTGGALIGGLTSITFAIVFNGIPGVMDDPPLKGINWMWVGGMGTVLGLTVGYVASFAFAAPTPERLAGLTVYAKPQTTEPNEVA